MVKMRDPANRAALLEEFNQGKGPLHEPMVGAPVTGYNLSLEHAQKESLKRWEGMSIQEIAADRKQNLVEALLDVALEDDLKSEWRTEFTSVPPEVMAEVLNGDWVCPGVSDGGAHTKFTTLGTWPTELLVNCVRTHNMISLEDLHWKTSTLPCMAAGILDRGHLEVGMPADILVYDFHNLKVGPTEKVYDQPGGEWRRIRRAEGYRFILVNGEITFEDGKCTGATPGKLLRHGRASPLQE